MPQSIEEIIKRARELKKAGLSTTEISDELKLDGETVLWLLMGKERAAPPDVYVDISQITASPERTSMLGAMLASLVGEGADVDVVVATGVSSITLGFATAAELGADFCYARPIGETVYLSIDDYRLKGKKAIVVQDVIAGGAVVKAVVDKLKEIGADVRLVVTFLNKRALEEVSGVKVMSLVEMHKIEQAPPLP